ncbi:MAG TPA: cyclic nucleotide-binding domain-containing protein [Dissulfurispiraceae bacterium]|nr:cyclic nucleotide-binding domain-containing protein [Dissulfurispiraceae bacterium]
MRKIADKLKFSDGDLVVKEGSFGDSLYLILSGTVEISKIVKGKKAVIAVLEKGAIIGELSFIDKKPRPASGRAVGDVEIGVIDKEFIDSEINKMSYEFSLLLNALAERLRTTTEEYAALKAEHERLKEKLGIAGRAVKL